MNSREDGSRARRLLAAAIVAVVAGIGTSTLFAGDGVIRACVERDGDLRIAGPRAQCGHHEALIEWNRHGPAGPVGPTGPAGPAGPPGMLTIEYVFGAMVPGTSVARAYCPAGTKVTGGGGFSINGAGLQQNFPISDTTGVVAFGTTAIGWQVAASDWSDVQAHVVCAS